MVASVWGNANPQEAYAIPPADIVIEQSGDYLIQAADEQHVIDYIGTGGDTFTMPSTTEVGNGFVVWVRNMGSGTINLSTQAGDTIAVASIGAAQMVQFLVKGTVYTRLASAALDSIASGIEYTPSGNLVATNLQAAVDELEAEKLPIAGGTLTGKLVQAAGENIASAATVDLRAATGNFVRITGTTAIATVQMTAGQQCRIVADAALPLTYHATDNKLNTGGLSVTLDAGDMVQYTCDLAGIVHGEIIKAAGTTVVERAPSFVKQYFPTF